MVGNVVAADAMMSGGDGQPETLVGVTVTLSGEHAMGETMETGMDGGFAFTGLRAGTYTVTISDFPEDVSFETVSVEVEVAVGEVGQADFTGHYIRTSAVEGQVVIEGEGLAGVTVTLSGGPADESYTAMTDADGMYRFEELRPGDYTVSISDFDTRDYEFAATSQDVSVDLDETGTVSFTGVLLRTSGISGRVSVEGMGLGDIEVTLAGGDESRTATTDEGGQYNFAGLAAGDYTVTIAVESDAYVFDSMSEDVALGDDEARIVNFEGAHARTASVSGQLFLDELDKNNMMDAGEHPLAQAGIPVALVGPGVNDQRLSATGPDGSFMFPGLQAGSYQLVVPIDATVAAALAANDIAYGGPGTGYAFALGVGESKSQAVPFDITHTTVNFSVALKHGDDDGPALEGATVDLFSDKAGETKVGGGMTGADGSAAIKVARAGTSGNMVYAGVTAEGYHVADGLTEVSWDPQMFATEAVENANDIVNLNVNATFKGATITTDAGGGEALADWAISVMMGDDAVEGADAMFDDDGMAGFESTLDYDDLPVTYTISLAEEQDDDLTGGEMFDAADLEYPYNGLALAGEMDFGTLEAFFTTQTLNVYVHEERDQVHGFTGNILAGDRRHSGLVSDKLDVEVRYIASSGRSRPITSDVWNADKNTKDDKKGGLTFSHLPAGLDIIVVADAARDANVVLADPDEIAAFEDFEDNGVMGGAFGDQGGVSHTVSLCPLMSVDPTGQDHDMCGSFAYVSTHAVTGSAFRNGVIMDAAGEGFTLKPGMAEAGTQLDMTPVEGKNLEGRSASFTAAEKNDKNTAWDDRKEFNFNRMAAGRYAVAVTDGWKASTGKEFTLSGDVDIMVEPETGVLYGYVIDANQFGVSNVMVDVNGRSSTTDQFGRYIVTGFKAVRGQLFVNATGAGFDAVKDSTKNAKSNVPAFAANTPTEYTINIEGTTETGSVSGRVTTISGQNPVAGVEILIDYPGDVDADGKAIGPVPPVNAAKSGANAGKVVTDADGKYTATFKAQGSGSSVHVSVRKDGMHFTPAAQTVPAHKGAASENINFGAYPNATISGRVTSGGQALEGVKVTATKAGATAAEAEYTTSERGIFVLSVSGGSFTIAASKKGYSFEYPETGNIVAVNAGQRLTFDIKATLESTTALDKVTVNGASVTADDDDMYKHEVGYDVMTASIVATAAHPDAKVAYSEDKDDDPSNGAQIDLDVGKNMVTATVTLGDASEDHEIEVTRKDAGASAPQMLEAASPSSGMLQISWRPPANTGRTLVDGYEYRVDAGDWTDSDVPVNGGTQDITTTADGLAVTVSVRAWGDSGEEDDAATTDVDESRLYGDEASITASSWPDVSSTAFDPTTVEEVDDDETNDVAENESVLTITMAGRAFEAYDLVISVADDDQAGLVSFASRVTVPRGQTEVEVTVTAVDDDKAPAEAGATSTAVAFNVELAPAEAEDRDAYDAGSLTINDDETATDPTDPPDPPAPTSAVPTPSLTISSPAPTTDASPELSVSWGHVDFGNLENPGYQFRISDEDDAWVDWQSASNGGGTSLSGNTQALVSGTEYRAAVQADPSATPPVAAVSQVQAALVYGVSQDVWVRAMGTDPNFQASTPPAEDDPATAYVDESNGMMYSVAAKVTGTPWPNVTIAVTSPSDSEIPEGDDEDTENVVENEAELTVSVPAGIAVFSAFDVTISVVNDEHAALVTIPNQGRATVPTGTAPSVTVTVTAVDDGLAPAAGATSTAVAFGVETAGRDRVEPSSGATLTITDDDTAPSETTGVAATQTSGDNYSLSWTFAANGWGTSETGRKFQYRVKEGADFVTDATATGYAADQALWADVPGGQNARSHGIVLAAPATAGTNTYYIQVRAVTDAGAGTAGEISGGVARTTN